MTAGTSADLTGQMALVTAAARGLGRRHAEGLAASGATVVLTDLDEGVLAVAAGSRVRRDDGSTSGTTTGSAP